MSFFVIIKLKGGNNMIKLEIRYLEIVKIFLIVFSNIVNLDEYLSYLENLENNNLKKE